MLKPNENFKYYFASGQSIALEKHFVERKIPRLQSFVNEKRAILRRTRDGGVTFIDSGAFSAMTQGAEINVDDYINFLNEYDEGVEICCQWDTIPVGVEPEVASQQTWDNYWYMRERLKSPEKLLYVFHEGEDYKWLEKALQHDEITYIALGGVAKKPFKIRDKFFETCFEIISKVKPTVKTHAFGMTNLEILENYPFESADSTTWLMAAINGELCTKYGRICVSQQVQHKPSHYNKLPQLVQQQINEQCVLYGTSIEQCMEDQDSRQLYNINYFKDWADNYKYKGNNRYQKRLF